MTTPIRWGIIGTGNMAKNFARDFVHAGDGVLAAVASRDEKKARNFSDEFSIPASYGRYEDLAADQSLDIVYIATPHHSHLDNSILCLRAGRAVLCEKPFTINRGQADAVFEVAQKAQKFLLEAMWTRFLPSVETLRGLLNDGRIGTLSMIEAGGGFMPPYDPNYYLFDASKGGGVLLDAGVYLIHFATMILGAPDRVAAVGHIGSHQVDEQIAVLLGYDRGVMANLHVSLKMKSMPDAVVYGDRGKIHVHGPIFNPSGLTITDYNGAEEHVSFKTDGGYAYQAREAMRCLNAGLLESPMMPWAETRNVMTIMDDVRRQIGLVYPMEQSA